jgi:2-polyprenyl-6-hydroxyphenyl methylase/3-demethylubiquinone-9 3-methyltransferase
VSDAHDTAALHEEGWHAHEAAGKPWRDPTTAKRKVLAAAALRDLGAAGSVRLLDFGCGDAVFTEFFHSIGYRVQGVDISETIIKRSRERLPSVPFECVRSGQALPYATGGFDAIFCSEVIEHLYDTHSLFHEFARLLRPGGLLILTTPYHGRIKNVVIALFFFEHHFDPTWQHIRFWTKKSLTRVCLAHQLRPTTWKYVGRFWPVPKSFFVVCRKEG